jgi:hypothetical protein
VFAWLARLGVALAVRGNEVSRIITDQSPVSGVVDLGSLRMAAMQSTWDRLATQSAPPAVTLQDSSTDSTPLRCAAVLPSLAHACSSCALLRMPLGQQLERLVRHNDLRHSVITQCHHVCHVFVFHLRSNTFGYVISDGSSQTSEDRILTAPLVFSR